MRDLVVVLAVVGVVAAVAAVAVVLKRRQDAGGSAGAGSRLRPEPAAPTSTHASGRNDIVITDLERADAMVAPPDEGAIGEPSAAGDARPAPAATPEVVVDPDPTPAPAAPAASTTQTPEPEAVTGSGPAGQPEPEVATGSGPSTQPEPVAATDTASGAGGPGGTAAEDEAEPTLTAAGLPRRSRSPLSDLAARTGVPPRQPSTATPTPRRSPEELRAMLSEYQQRAVAERSNRARSTDETESSE